MQFSVAAIIVAAGAVAAHKSNVTVTTEIVDQYVTYCPGPTQITHGTKTWTVTAPTTLTITDCPCTVTKPVITTSTVICNNCPSKNATVVPPTKTVPPTVPTAGAGKAAALSGAGLAGFVGLAALVL